VLTPGPDDGFSVDPASLHGVAGQIGKAYDDLNTAITRYGGSQPATPGDFGSEVSPAWSNFDGAWAQELDVLSLATMEMIGNVSNAATGYTTADVRAAGAARQVAG
jgi:hypothetical protein